jgi:hypothetical protein
LIFLSNCGPAGDLLREEDVLEWLVHNKNTGDDEEDVIEDVTAKTLDTLISSSPHLAVLFCESNGPFPSARVLLLLGAPLIPLPPPIGLHVIWSH